MSKLKITALKTGRSKVFSSVKEAHTSTGISEYTLRRIKRDSFLSICKGKDGKDGEPLMFHVEVVQEYVCELTPAFDTVIPTQKFLSHYKAIKFLGCSKDTYSRRRNMQPVGTPCDLPIRDRLGQEWIITFLVDKEEFKLNK